jgi:hypothetical protein
MSKYKEKRSSETPRRCYIIFKFLDGRRESGRVLSKIRRHFIAYGVMG